MIFRYIHEKQSANGATERSSSEYPHVELMFGRGGGSHIVLTSPKVGVEHVKFSWEGGQLVVCDLGAFSGVFVNSKRVKRAVLSDGDRVSFADEDILVRLVTGGVELIHTQKNGEKIPDEERAARKLASLRIDAHLPSMRILCVALAALSLTAFFVVPFSSPRKKSWSSGPISSAHTLIAADCSKCHTEPFQHVQDTQCLSCHQMSAHAKGIEAFTDKHARLGMRCAQCHMEHNGDNGIVLKDSRVCASCHANMTALNDDATIENVASFDSHPQFRIPVWDATGAVRRVSLDDAAHAVDSSAIKLNHKAHLKEGLRGPHGPVTLQCSACHRLSPDFKKLEPISFDRHCRECHSLGFDERLPYAEVPHGDAEAVYPSLFAEYAKVILLNDDESLANPAQDAKRDMPGEVRDAASSAGPATVDAVVENAREAEKQLFTRTACFLCHSYSEKPQELQTAVNSHYAIVKPSIPDVWFSAARFSHGAHEEFACESCHDKARGSSKTADVLLPKKELCQECHISGRRDGHVQSDCTQCHSYHDALGFPGEKKQDIAGYLNRLTR